MLTGQIALFAEALGAGAGLYALLCEQPARLKLPEDAAVQEYKISYPRMAALEYPLCALGFMCGLIAYYSGGSIFHLLGSILIALEFAFVSFVIMPIDKELMSMDKGSARSKELMRKWGDLHTCRMIGGAFILACFFLGSLLA